MSAKQSFIKAAHSLRESNSTHSTTTDHINNARKCFAKIRNKSAGMKEVGSYLDKAFGLAGEVGDHTTLAQHHIRKALSGMGVDLGPAESGDGYDASRENVQRKPADIMTEGATYDGDVSKPWPGKTLGNPLDDNNRALLKVSLAKSLGKSEADSIMAKIQEGTLSEDEGSAIASRLIGRKSWRGWGPGGPLTAGH